MPFGRTPRPIVLILDHEESTSHALKSVLEQRGYEVRLAHTEERALSILRGVQPDAMLVNARLAEGSGVAFCEEIRRRGPLEEHVPVIITSAGSMTRTERIAAIQAGAWEVVTHPIDGELLLSKIDTFRYAVAAVGRERERALVDSVTGLYTARGLDRRAEELRAQTYRDRTPLAAVAFGVELTGAEATDEAVRAGSPTKAAMQLADALRQMGRASDAIARTSATRFCVLASNCNEDGARALARRITEGLSNSLPEGAKEPPHVFVGIAIAENVRERPEEADDVVVRAEMDLSEAMERRGS